MRDQTVTVNGEIVDRLDDTDPDLARAFEDFREALEQDEGSTGWMKVYRIPVDMYGNPVSRGKNRSELFNFPWGTMQPDDVVDRVRQKFMRRGESRITIQITGGKTGERGIKLNRFITIERENEPEVKEKDSVSEIMQMLQESQRAADERAERMLAALAVNRTTPQTDPMQQMVQMMGIMGMMIKVIMPGGIVTPGVTPGVADPFDQMTKMMGLMSSMKNFTAGDSPALSGPGGDADSVGNMLGSVATIAKSLAPMFARQAAEPSNAVAKPVVQRVPIRKKAMGHAAAPGSPNVLAEAPLKPLEPLQPMKITDAPDAANQTISNNNTANAEGDDVDMKTVKDNLLIIISMYESGSKAAAVAKLMVDAVPVEGHDELVDLVSDDDFVEKMGVYDARVIADERSREWFESLADETLTLLASDD